MELMDCFGNEATHQIQEFSAQNLANTAYAFGKLIHYMPALLDATGMQATALIKV